jgi:hypothetical protein
MNGVLNAYAATCFLGFLVLFSAGFVVNTSHKEHVSPYGGESITSLTYGRPLRAFSRLNVHVVYALLLTTLQTLLSDRPTRQRTFLTVTTVFSLVIFVLAWARSSSANTQNLPGLASVHLSAVYLVGVVGLAFQPACLAWAIRSTKKPKNK